MRILLTAVCLGVLSFSTSAQDFKKEVGPIKVIKIERKEPISYDKDVEPIFFNRCTVCHSGNVKEGKFDISTYENLIKGGKRGDAVKPGKSLDSLLHKQIGRTQKPFMPPRGEDPVTPEELAIVKLWIDQVVRVGKAFSYDNGVPKGLLTGKKATFLVATGAVYGPGSAYESLNFIEPYLKTLFGFIGFTDVTFHSAFGAGALTHGANREEFLQPHDEAVAALAAA